MPLQTFEDALGRVEVGGRLSLLIGNGFSRALRDDIFNYASLLDRADFGDRDGTLRQLFERLDTYDFEAVMRLLESTATVLETYGNSEALLNLVRQDQEQLKNALISAISSSHLERPQDVRTEQFSAARLFLARFDAIFTVNYDLLLYWARNQDRLPPPGYQTDDGFRAERVWQEYDTRQNAHFLHGGLHIYEDNSSVKKLTHANADVPIIDQVRANLVQRKFPLFVAEPNSEKKLKRIERNPYLSYCYRALRKIEGTLIILGHSMDTNDRHIFKQIEASQVTRVLVSIHGDELSESNRNVRANALAFLGNPRTTIEFFDAESAEVWG